jgi:arabinose-5-phosphate isomerase
MIEYIQETLTTEANELLAKAEHVDEAMLKAVALIEQTKGKVIVIGVGKSGLVGAKISATLASTGTPSFFIHPTEALHGDLGMIGKEDLVIAISYSGESEELIKILPHIKKMEVKLIAMTNSATNSLASFSDAFVDI